ncbi:hypothetical protein [Geobacter sp. SVR]|uniref:hypothetical protein n=1 Tax=Geobacter sp. SVR TaxID=2495594 RepID=UPI00143EFFCB|nr:hypothetical protein [Geobacter sp. SVR]BCS55752.1 hypothetical protein GSVR_40600 [Geobacter sp. SVR]GCF83756.1 hypothetical protein GSbR_03560 [Geobacter sp. SVR]
MKTLNVSALVLCLWAAIISGCGGGGSGAGGVTTAVVKVATSGTLPADTRIGGVFAHVLANPSSGLSLATDEVAVTGAGAGSTLVPNVDDAADVSLGLINATGIQAGEFATLNYHVVSGTSVPAGTFGIADGASVVDIHGAAVPGLSVVILSVTLQ